MALSKVDYNSLNVTPTASKALKWNSSADGFEAGDLGGSLVLLATETASSSATISFTSDIDSTYKVYLFKFTDLHPATDNVQLMFNFSIDGGSNYNVSKAHTFVDSYHDEAGTDATLTYSTAHDMVGTGFAKFNFNVGNDNDQSASGYMHLFDPSSTTFVKQYMAQQNNSHNSDYTRNTYVAGYGNTTSAVDAVQFKFSSGNIDSGVIKMYGIT